MPPVFSMPCGGGPITANRIVLTGIITLGSGIQLILFARRVYFAREHYNIPYPAVTGNAHFERIYRAQQNTLEWYPVFMTALWTSALFFHQVPSAVCGVLYIISRHRYFRGYSHSVEERVPGVLMGIRVVGVMGIMAAVGLGRTLLRMLLASGQAHGWEGPRLNWRFSH